MKEPVAHRLETSVRKTLGDGLSPPVEIHPSAKAVEIAHGIVLATCIAHVEYGVLIPAARGIIGRPQIL